MAKDMGRGAGDLVKDMGRGESQDVKDMGRGGVDAAQLGNLFNGLAEGMDGWLIVSFVTPVRGGDRTNHARAPRRDFHDLRQRVAAREQAEADSQQRQMHKEIRNIGQTLETVSRGIVKS